MSRVAERTSPPVRRRAGWKSLEWDAARLVDGGFPKENGAGPEQRHTASGQPHKLAGHDPLPGAFASENCSSPTGMVSIRAIAERAEAACYLCVVAGQVVRYTA